MSKASLNFIKYLWEHKVVSLKEMIKKVYKKEISEEEFFDITRYHFKSVTKR